MKKLFLIVFLFNVSILMGQQLDIGVMRSYSISSVEFDYGNGVYDVYGDTSLITNIWSDQKIRLKRSGEKVKVVKGDRTLGYYDTVYIKQQQPESFLKVQVVAPSVKKTKQYADNFKVVIEKSDRLKVINEVDMPNYLAGVIESEGGGGKHLEYYKVQAILSRTYALDHLSKHKKEGFNLCSDVHCQAYHNKLRFTPSIQQAVNETKGIIMIDQNYQLANGFFFANCGGQTSEADFVWHNPVNYCKSVKDTFCIDSRQANWTKKIEKYKWKNYLVNQFGFPVNDSIFGPFLYYFLQDKRMAFYGVPQLGIPLRDLRVEFKLKSTWFNVHLEGESVVLEGKGFGHGVGLCQEGAMKMANLGFTAKEILNFYFTGIQLEDYYHWSFFRQRQNAVSTMDI